MITQSFLQSGEYAQFKEILKEELTFKPITIKTDGKTNEVVAREVAAYEMAVKIVSKAFKKFERMVEAPTVKTQTWR